jgi:DNA polymerase III epsilon subunit-like protein
METSYRVSQYKQQHALGKGIYMRDFIAIDFETANSRRVSACALGYAQVTGGNLVASKEYLIKPIGGHAPYQSKIHGIKEEHTFDKPTFAEMLPEIQDIFKYPLVAHSLFDKQVLSALSNHFNLGLKFKYVDSYCLAKERLPGLANYKLKTLAQYFKLPAFKHHNAKEDAIACANIFLKLIKAEEEIVELEQENEMSEFMGLTKGILADDIVNYKEAFTLLYWLEDHPAVAEHHQYLYQKLLEVLDDHYLDKSEEKEIKHLLQNALGEKIIT